MEQNIIINIGIYKALCIIGTIIAGAWYASHRLTKVETNVEGFDKRLTNIEGRMDASFGNGSPIKLLAKGELILEKSGLKKYIDDNFQSLKRQCGAEMDNPYDIQNSAFTYFEKLDFGALEAQIKTTAFEQGVGLPVIRRIGGIYLRDLCLKEAGFKLEDLDQPIAPTDTENEV